MKSNDIMVTLWKITLTMRSEVFTNEPTFSDTGG